ncbi:MULTISPECIES: phage/plasmid primase, P4 family [unclassified Sporolactobacillus]|uniref:phage/plasmid primase, P4 family n=1 Tax=unclassified Sporolactobacillus TaxID=2628533 RepID=UPI0023676DFA|nr:phage/plasmid primase, P4 family [Sporolactobacillus sp. CQH2019]MDD9150418.1 phage/plasmid primase, P4 family [Sporolactobacillus sp. CQH2019]
MGPVEAVNLAEMFPHTTLKVIRLAGYSRQNKVKGSSQRYQAAKRPCMRDWSNLQKPGLNGKAAELWLVQKGWTGLVIPSDYVVVDIDDEREGEQVLHALNQEGLKFHAIQTPNGCQFIFKDSAAAIRKQGTKLFMACGCAGDYRTADRGQIVLPSRQTPGRTWVRTETGRLSEVPIYFYRLFSVKSHPRPFTLPITEGGRNDTLYKHACRLIEFGYSPDQVRQIVEFMNHYFLSPSLPADEVAHTLNSALEKPASGKIYAGSPPDKQSAAEGETKSFKLTELGNAERLVHFNGNNLCYCVEFEEWLLWNGHTWIEDKMKRIERVAMRTFRAMYKEAAMLHDDTRRQELFKWAKTSEKSNVFLNSIHRAEAMLPVSQQQLNKDKFLLNCQNGVLDLKTGQLLQPERRYLMTMNTHIVYDAQARCPTWMTFLKSILCETDGTPKLELLDFLQRAIGYALTGDTREQVIFFLWGQGNNGKSTLLNVIKAMLGDYAKQTNSDTFTAKVDVGNAINNDIARLNGARFVPATESEEGKKLSEALVKQLTGGEAITARFLRKEFFEYTPEFKIFFATNYKPIVRGSDDGIWRRIRLLPFEHKVTPDQVDKELPEKLMKELPGILHWAVEGCLKWQRDGLGTPREVRQATADYKEEMDLLHSFIADCCLVNSHSKVLASTLHKTYLRWAEENGEFQMKQRAFNTKMEMRGFQKRRSTGNKVFFFGIGLSTDAPLPSSFF